MTITKTLTAVLLAGAGLTATTMATGANAETPAGIPSTSASSALSCAAPGPATYRAYGNALINAWAKGNGYLARCYATTDVADFLFAQNPKGTGWTYAGTQVLDGSARVTYRGAGGAQLRLSIIDPANSQNAPAVYATAMNGAAQGRVTAYADKLVRAWGAGDKQAARKLATPKVVNALWFFSKGPGGPCWVRDTTLTGLESKAASITYRCESASVTVTVKNWRAAQGAPQSVVGVVTQAAG